MARHIDLEKLIHKPSSNAILDLQAKPLGEASRGDDHTVEEGILQINFKLDVRKQDEVNKCSG